jgi:hypothetical protein
MLKNRKKDINEEKKDKNEENIDINITKVKRKRMIPHIKPDGTIEEHEIELPDDQEEMPIISPEEYQNNQPIIRKEFVSVLNKTFNDINESIAKINGLESKIKSLENIIIEHNELLKKIVNIISK